MAVLERGRVGDPATASYGRTRSYRSDYLDAGYARLADEAIRLWDEFEAGTGTDGLVRCGCMNIAKRAVTPDLASTYAQLQPRDADAPRDAGRSARRATRCAARFPFLDADSAASTRTPAWSTSRRHRRAARARSASAGTATVEGATRRAIERDGDASLISDAGEFVDRALVVTAGHGTNDVLALLPGNHLQVPITKDRPSEAKYFRRPPTSATASPRTRCR